MDELDGLDAVDQADLVRRGEVTSLELIEAAIARIEAAAVLDAVITPTFELARAARVGCPARRSVGGCSVPREGLRDGVGRGPVHGGFSLRWRVHLAGRSGARRPVSAGWPRALRQDEHLGVRVDDDDRTDSIRADAG